MFKKLASCFLLLLCCSLPATAAEDRILVYGDSLSAGFGISVNQSWPALLGQRLQAKPVIVILALGANDGLRGLPVAAMEDNLTFMVKLAKKHKARMLLVGMHLPPNYGPKYTAEFDAAFRNIAKRETIALLPFLLEPIALDRNAYQADGLHPTAAAQTKLLEHVWSALQALLG
jgi:acyl-CoA thioesterase-1